jgi:hypothetical protein
MFCQQRMIRALGSGLFALFASMGMLAQEAILLPETKTCFCQ